MLPLRPAQGDDDDNEEGIECDGYNLCGDSQGEGKEFEDCFHIVLT